jgi:hypothetical protein
MSSAGWPTIDAASTKVAWPQDGRRLLLGAGIVGVAPEPPSREVRRFEGRAGNDVGS